MHELKH